VCGEQIGNGDGGGKHQHGAQVLSGRRESWQGASAGSQEGASVGRQGERVQKNGAGGTRAHLGHRLGDQVEALSLLLGVIESFEG
jgi:hypothetical protein